MRRSLLREGQWEDLPRQEEQMDRQQWDINQDFFSQKTTGCRVMILAQQTVLVGHLTVFKLTLSHPGVLTLVLSFFLSAARKNESFFLESSQRGPPAFTYLLGTLSCSLFFFSGEQGSANYGPRVNSGPQAVFVKFSLFMHHLQLP